MKPNRSFSLFLIYFFSLVSQACSTQPAVSSASLALVKQSDFLFRGAFTFPDGDFGGSSINWSSGVMEVKGSSIFIVGSELDDAIAEFKIPSLQRDQLAVAGPPVQSFVSPLKKLSSNSEGLDQITGMELVDGQLLLNAVEFYDAPADNRMTTIVVDDAENLSASAVKGPFAMRGGARAAGWLSDVPDDWRAILGCSHISGYSSGGPIIARHSVGPSAFCVNLNEFSQVNSRDTVNNRELLGYTLNFPLARDLFNEKGNNNLWTHLSQATYGFIIPGTSTYATLGNSGGHESGVGYKLSRGDGQECPGYCARLPDDVGSFYWLWDMRDLIQVFNGRRSPSDVQPYAWGDWPLPFNVPVTARLGGASYDESSGLLYLSLLNISYNANKGTNVPVVLVYSIAR